MSSCLAVRYLCPKSSVSPFRWKTTCWSSSTGIAQQHFATRSEAVRQLIRNNLTAHAWESDAQDAAGTLTLVYDHHRPQLAII